MSIDRNSILARIAKEEYPLIARQSGISLPILERLFKKMQFGIELPPIQVSTDRIIINGHHRYISALIANYDLKITSNYPKPSYLNVIDWNDVSFTVDDWDTAAKIRRLNEQDAAFNGMSLEKMKGILG